MKSFSFLPAGSIVVLAIAGFFAWSQWLANQEPARVAEAARWLPADQFDNTDLNAASKAESDSEGAIGQVLCAGSKWFGPNWDKVSERKIRDDEMNDGECQPLAKQALRFTQDVGEFLSKNYPCQKSADEAERLNNRGLLLYAEIKKLKVVDSSPSFKLRLRCWVLVWVDKYNGMLPQFIELSKIHSKLISSLKGADDGYRDWTGKVSKIKDSLDKFFGRTTYETGSYLDKQIRFPSEASVAWAVPDAEGTIATPIIAKAAREVAEKHPLKISAKSPELADSINAIRATLDKNKSASPDSKLRRVLEARAEYGDEILKAIEVLRTKPESERLYSALRDANAADALKKSAEDGECDDACKEIEQWIKARLACEPGESDKNRLLLSAWAKSKQDALTKLSLSAPTPELSELVADEAKRLAPFVAVNSGGWASVRAMCEESKKLYGILAAKPFPLIDQLAKDRKTLVDALIGRVQSLNTGLVATALPEDFLKTPAKPESLTADSAEAKLFSGLDAWAKSVGALNAMECGADVATKVPEITKAWIDLSAKAKDLVGATDLAATLQKESSPWSTLAEAAGDFNRLTKAWIIHSAELGEKSSSHRIAWAMATLRQLAVNMPLEQNEQRAKDLCERVAKLRLAEKSADLAENWKRLGGDTATLAKVSEQRIKFLKAHPGGEKIAFAGFEYLSETTINPALNASTGRIRALAEKWAKLQATARKLNTAEGEMTRQVWVDFETALKASVPDSAALNEGLNALNASTSATPEKAAFTTPGTEDSLEAAWTKKYDDWRTTAQTLVSGQVPDNAAFESLMVLSTKLEIAKKADTEMREVDSDAFWKEKAPEAVSPKWDSAELALLRFHPVLGRDAEAAHARLVKFKTDWTEARRKAEDPHGVLTLEAIAEVRRAYSVLTHSPIATAPKSPVAEGLQDGEKFSPMRTSPGTTTGRTEAVSSDGVAPNPALFAAVKAEAAPWEALDSAKGDVAGLYKVWADHHSTPAGKRHAGWAVAVYRQILNLAEPRDSDVTLAEAKKSMKERLAAINALPGAGAMEEPLDKVKDDDKLMSDAWDARLNFLSSVSDDPDAKLLEKMQAAEFNEPLKASYSRLKPVVTNRKKLLAAESEFMGADDEGKTGAAFEQWQSALKEGVSVNPVKPVVTENPHAITNGGRKPMKFSEVINGIVEATKATNSSSNEGAKEGGVASSLERRWFANATARCLSSSAVALWDAKEWEDAASLNAAKVAADRKSGEWMGKSENLHKLWTARAKALGFAYELLNDGVKARWDDPGSTAPDDMLKNPDLRRWWVWHPQTHDDAAQFARDLNRLRDLQKDDFGLSETPEDPVNFDITAVNARAKALAATANKDEWHRWLFEKQKALIDDCNNARAAIEELGKKYAVEQEAPGLCEEVAAWAERNRKIAGESHSKGIRLLINAHVERAEYFSHDQSYKIQTPDKIKKEQWCFIGIPRCNGGFVLKGDYMGKIDNGEAILWLNEADLMHIKFDEVLDNKVNPGSEYASRIDYGSPRGEKRILWKIGKPLQVTLKSKFISTNEFFCLGYKQSI